jgi:UDP-2,3-diacylglucosamine pyrophosphatase LpxH
MATLTQRLIVISDLHLGSRVGVHIGSQERLPEVRREGAAACAAFLRSVVLPAGDRTHLVFLGDMFELRDHPAQNGGPEPATPAGGGLDEEWAIHRLGALARAYPDFFEALAACLDAGCHLDIVPGNHDMALARPAVRQCLDELLGQPAEGSRLQVHPWLYVVPGLLYAEHGHQHHDLNRFPTVLVPGRFDDPDRDFIAPLAAWHSAAHAPAHGGPARGGPTHSAPPRRVPAFHALAKAILDSRRHEHAARSVAYRSAIDTHAGDIGLRADVVTQLHDLSRFRLTAVALRLIRKILSRRLRTSPDAYLIAAASSAHRLLTRRGLAVPIYAFGHTHHARVVKLDEHAWYANAGTWSAEVRGTGLDRDDAGLFPYLDIAAGVTFEALKYWRWPVEQAPVDSLALPARSAVSRWD